MGYRSLRACSPHLDFDRFLFAEEPLTPPHTPSEEDRLRLRGGLTLLEPPPASLQEPAGANPEFLGVAGGVAPIRWVLFGREGPFAILIFHSFLFSGTRDLTTIHPQKETFPTVTLTSIQASGAARLPLQLPCPQEPPPPPPLHLLSPSTPLLPIPPRLPDQPPHPPTTPWPDQRPPHPTTRPPPQLQGESLIYPPRCVAARLIIPSTTSTTTRPTTSPTGRTGLPISEKKNTVAIF